MTHRRSAEPPPGRLVSVWRRRGSARGVGEARGADRRRGSGQSTVEFVLVLPFFALMLLALVQVGLLVRTRVLVTHAAREAVREAAVGAGDGEARAAALAAADLHPARLTVSVNRSAGRAEVELLYTDTTDVPLVGALIGDAVFEAGATMRMERLD